jgi:hypothetical protein
MISEADLWMLLRAWRADIDSVPMPTLVTVDTAVAVLSSCSTTAAQPCRRPHRSKRHRLSVAATA